MTAKEHVALKKEFRELLGGCDDIVRFEMDRGMFSGDPQFRYIQFEQRYRDALQTRAITSKISDGTTELLRPFKGTVLEGEVDPNIMTILAANAAGTVKELNPILLVGAKGVDQKTLGAMQAMRGGKR